MHDKEDANVNYPQLLRQTYHEALERNENAQKHWNKLKEEYRILETLLGELPNDLSRDVMVSVAPRALMRGQIVHSNEILVCLGQGYFVKRTAAQAAAICQRRETVCCNMLQSLEREKDLFEGRSNLPLEQDAFGGCREIIEEYDEEKEQRWRVENKQKEREYRQKLAELRAKEKVAVTDEESLWKRLDELELQEELEEELDRLHADRTGDEDDDDDDDEEEEEEEAEEEEEEEEKEQEDESDIQCDREKMRMEEMHDKMRKDAADVKNKSFHLSQTMSGRRVSFAGVQEEQKFNHAHKDEEIELKITFKHSANTTSAPTHTLGELNSIRSPGELYTHFKEQFLKRKKSILKKTSSYESYLGSEQSTSAREEWPKRNEELHNSENTCNLPAPPPVLNEVLERDVAVSAPVPSAVRPMSRFKAMRQIKKM